MSAAHDGSIHVRSYRVCFRLERRLHKIDRWKIPVPHGVPLRGIGYACALLLAVVILGSLPVVEDVLGTVSPWFRYIVLPGLAAWALSRWTIDGRSAPAAGIAWLRWRHGTSRISAFRSAPPTGAVVLGDITVAPDERSAALRGGVVRGPATLILRYPVSATPRGSTLRVTQSSHEPLWRGKQVRLRPGQRVVTG